MATGIIVTRAATDAQLGSEVAKQIAAYPKSLIMVCFSLLGLLFLKGIPVVPVFIIFILFATAAWFATRSKQNESIESNDESLYDKIRIHPIEIQMNPQLFIELSAQESTLLPLIQQLRERLAYDLGFVIPDVKLRAEKKLNYPYYALCIQGNNHAVNQLHLDKMLAISTKQSGALPLKGIDVRDPSYGLKSTWIIADQRPTAIEAGFTVCEPLTVLTTHLNDTVQHHLAALLSRNETETLLNQSTISNQRDELIPGILPFGHVQRVLQNLLEEKVSIRLLPSILDVLLEHGKTITDTHLLTELVRARLADPICQKLMTNQTSLPVLTLAPALEQQLHSGLNNQQFALEPGLTEHFIVSLAGQVEKMLTDRKKPVLLCSSLLRRQIKQLTQRVIPHLTVLGMNEIPINIQIESFSVVT